MMSSERWVKEVEAGGAALPRKRTPIAEALARTNLSIELFYSEVEPLQAFSGCEVMSAFHP